MKPKIIKGDNVVLVILIFLATMLAPIRAEAGYSVIATLKPSNPRGFGGFGGDIALSEDLLLIGEWWGKVEDVGAIGLAYLYDADWNLLSTLTAPEPQPNAEFGHTVALQGDMMVIGCPRHDVEGIDSVGEAYVFDTDGVLQFILQSPDPKGQGKFGVEVALGKDVILVGETGGTVQGFIHAGAVHVYDTDGEYITTLTSPSMKHNGAFGENIATNTEFILIGEPGVAESSLHIVGSTHVFDYDWNLIKTIQAPEQEEHTWFGKSIAIRGETVVIGEIYAEVDGHPRAGKAYIYDTDWNLVAKLQSPAPRDGGEFGRGTAIGGDIVVVGERRGDVTTVKEGKAYVFGLEGDLVATLTAPDPTVGAQFGYKVATDGEIVVVADVEGTVDGESKAGKVHVFGFSELATKQPEEEVETTETESESESESEKSGGIPGFPIESVVISIVLAVMMLWLIERQR